MEESFYSERFGFWGTHRVEPCLASVGRAKRPVGDGNDAPTHSIYLISVRVDIQHAERRCTIAIETHS